MARVNPLAQIQASLYAGGAPARPRQGITFMPPAGMPVARRAAVAPTRRTVGGGGSIADRAFANQEAFGRFAEQMPEQAATADAGGPGGLGWVVGKAAKGGMAALSVLDYPRAFVNAAVAEGFDVALPALNEPLGALPGIHAQKYDKEAIDSSFDWGDLWKNTKEHKGFGELIVEPIMGEKGTDRNKWVKRGFGLAGDIAADPFTYSPAFGVNATAGKASRAEYLAKLAEVQARAPSLVERGVLTAKQAAELGGEEALEKMSRRGVGLANPTQAAAMGIDPNSLKLYGYAMPGTERISRKLSEATGAAKQVIGQAPGVGLLRGATTRRGYLKQDLLPAYERMLTGQGPDTIVDALNTIAGSTVQRKAGATFEGLANRELRALARKTKGVTGAERQEMIRRAELGLERNPFSEYAIRVREAAAKVGVELPEMQDGVYVMPHSISRDFRNFLDAKIAKTDPRRVDFFKEGDITADDLLEEGGFLQRRSFRPGKDGTPQNFTIGDQTLTIETGTVEELNRKLGAMFPEFKGQIYETDPFEAWRRYINATKGDVALMAWGKQGANRGWKGLVNDPGIPENYDPYGGREALAPRQEPWKSPGEVKMVNGKMQWVPSEGSTMPSLFGQGSMTPPPIEQVSRVTPNPEAKPTSPYYDFVPDAAATKARDLEVIKTQTPVAEDYAITSLGRREGIARQIDEAGEQLMEPINAERVDLAQQGAEAHGRVVEAEEAYKGLLRNRSELTDELDGVNRQINNERAKLRRIQRTADTNTIARQKARLDELLDAVPALEERLSKLNTQMDEAIDRVGKAHLPGSPEQKAIEGLERTRIAQHSNELESAASDARHQYEMAKRAEIEAIGKNYVTDGKLNQAVATVRRNQGKIRERGGVRSVTESVAKRRTILEDQAERLDDEAVRRGENLQRAIDANTTSGKPAISQRAVNKERAEIAQLNEASAKLKQQSEDLYNQHRRTIEREYSSPVQRASETIEKRRLQNERVERAAASQHERAERAFRDLEDWRLAVKERGWVQQPDGSWVKWGGKAEAGTLDAAERKAMTSAERTLSRRKSKEYLYNEKRLETVENAIKRVSPEGRRRTAEEVAANRKFQAEAKQIRQYLRNNKELGRQVHGAQATVKELTQKQAGALAAAKAAAPTSEHPRLTGEYQVPKEAEPPPPTRIEATGETRLKVKHPLSTGAQRGQLEFQIEGLDRKIAAKQGQIGRARNEDRIKALKKELSALRADKKKVGLEIDAINEQGALLPTTEGERTAIDFETLPGVEKEIAAERQALTDVERRATNERRMRQPAILDTAEQLAETKRALGGKPAVKGVSTGMAPGEAEMAQIALEEGRKGMEAVKNVEPTLERLTGERATQQALIEEVDQATGHVIADYKLGMENQEVARARHAEISKKVEGLMTPERAGTMVRENKKQAEAAATRVRAYLKGDMTSYEVQPMRRVIDDLRKIIAANPLGDDAEMNRMEAVLHSLEGSLADLTDDVDVKRVQVNDILKAAQRGDLGVVLKAQLNAEYKLLWEGGDVLISREAKQMYMRVREGVEAKSFGRLMTLYTNFFKTYATLSPGFHVRNAMTAIFMNFTEGVPTGTAVKTLHSWREFAKVDDPIAWLNRLETKDKALHDAYLAVLSTGSGGQFFESGVGELSRGSTRIKEGLFANRLTKGSQRVGQDWVEGPQRLSLAYHTTRNGGTMEDAMQRIARIHFDYSQTSEFDEKAKRYIPFWTFTSRNMPLQFTQMWMKPKMYLRYQSFARNFSEPNPEFMPEYITEDGGINTGLKTPDWLPGAAAGMPIVLNPDLPHMRLQSDIARMAGPLTGESPGQALSQLNPAMTAPLEYMTGQDFFTGKRFGPDDFSPAGALTPIAPLLAAMGAARQGADGKWYIQDKAMNALRATIPPLDRTARLAPAAAGQKPNDRLLESHARFWGAPIRTISEDQMQSEAMRRLYEQRDRAKMLAATGG